MISHIKGTLLLKEDTFAIVDVSGVGYKVYASSETLSAVNSEGNEAKFWTYLSVKENALDLYGFETRPQVQMFEMLIGVSGIGPKGALGIMNIAPIETLTSAISSGDSSYLTKVSGVGKKTAQKIVLELQGKLGGITAESATGAMKEDFDVVEGLQSLGYSATEARKAIAKISSETKGTSDRIKEALKVLGGN